MTALWFASTGDVCALLVEEVVEGRGVLMSSMLRTGGGGGLSISNILRIGGLVVPPPLVPGSEECLATGGSTSNILLTGDRGVAKGEPVRAGPVELAEPFGLPPAVWLSRMAKTSFRSSSNTDSNDMSLWAMIRFMYIDCAS